MRSSRTKLAFSALALSAGAAAAYSCGGGTSGFYLPDGGTDASAGAGGTAQDSGAGGATGGLTGDGGSSGAGGAAGAGTGGGGSLSCRSDTECTPNGQVCDAVAGTCVECLFDSTCGDGRQCRNRTCVDMVPCGSSLDCVGQESALVCDEERGVCEDCVVDDDCGTDGECLRNVCSYFTRCTSSLNCPQGQVCDRSIGRCVTCVDALDCGSGQTCHSGECTKQCVSDKDCVSEGKLCDKSVSACVACLDHTTCPLAFYCMGGQCVLDECEAGLQACSEGAIVECTPVGDGMQTVGNCGAQTTCRALEGDATCEPWICSADQKYCKDGHVIECSADGLSVLSDQDCAADGGKVCINAACAACNNQVLLLSDSYTNESAAIKAALDSAGLVTTLIDSGITSYAGTPVASGFGAVLLVVGDAYGEDMPAAGQLAVVTAHAAGTGVVFTEWASYQVQNGRWAALSPLLLFTRTTGTSGSATYTSTDTTHPIWSGLPSSFSIGITMGFSVGNAANGGTAIATVTTGSYTNNPAVIVKEATGGRQVHVIHAASYQGHNWTGQPNLVTMFTNAARWATRCF